MSEGTSGHLYLLRKAVTNARSGLLLKASSGQVLKASMDRDSPVSLGNLFHCLPQVIFSRIARFQPVSLPGLIPCLVHNFTFVPGEI